MTVGTIQPDTQDSGAAGPLLVSGKNNVPLWNPTLEVPDWWGEVGASCGGCVAQKIDGDVITYVPVLCKRWCCDVCSYYRHAWLVRNIVDWIERWGFKVMWTLTLATGGRSIEESFVEIKRAWKKLRKRLVREFGHFEYIWVVETTQAGYAHLHVVVDRFLKHSVLRGMWKQITGDSDQVNFRKIKDGGAGRYIAKYVGKEARARRIAGGQVRPYHIFDHSAGVVFDDFTAKGQGWEVLEYSWKSWSAYLREYCEVLSDAPMGPGCVMVKGRAGEPWNRKWGDYDDGRDPPSFPELHTPVRARLFEWIKRDGSLSDRTKRLVDEINAERRGEAMIEGAGVYDADRLEGWEPAGTWECVDGEDEHRWEFHSNAKA